MRDYRERHGKRQGLLFVKTVEAKQALLNIAAVAKPNAHLGGKRDGRREYLSCILTKLRIA